MEKRERKTGGKKEKEGGRDAGMEGEIMLLKIRSAPIELTFVRRCS